MKFFFLALALVFSPLLSAFDVQKLQKEHQNARFILSSVQYEQYLGAPSLVLSFTVPLDIKTLQDSIKLNGTYVNSYELSDNRKKLYFRHVSPSTEYSIHVSKQIKDIFSKPFLIIDKQGNLSQTGSNRLYKVTTPAIKPELRFVHQGAILADSKQIALPVELVNINQVELSIFKVQPKHLPRLAYDWATGDKYYRSADYINDIANLVHSNSYQFDMAENERATVNLDLKNIDALEENAVYVALMKEAGRFQYELQSTYFSISQIGLHLRQYQDERLLIAQDIRTGKPLKGVTITTFSDNAQYQYKTNSQGMLTLPANFSHLTAQIKQQTSFLVVDSQHTLDLAQFNNPLKPHTDIQFFMWSERDLYRAGETVTIHSLIRDYDGRVLPAAQPYMAYIIDPRGNKQAVSIEKVHRLSSVCDKFIRIRKKDAIVY